MRTWYKRLLEVVLLAILAFSPILFVARSAQATDTRCNGTTIGVYCHLRYADETVCQDCGWVNCEVGCIGQNAQAYYYCVTTAYLWCLS